MMESVTFLGRPGRGRLYHGLVQVDHPTCCITLLTRLYQLDQYTILICALNTVSDRPLDRSRRLLLKLNLILQDGTYHASMRGKMTDLVSINRIL